MWELETEISNHIGKIASKKKTNKSQKKRTNFQISKNNQSENDWESTLKNPKEKRLFFEQFSFRKSRSYEIKQVM